MHELGIVFSIIDEVKKVAIENNVKHVNSTTLEIGEVSTIVPSYLEDVWNWAVKKEEILNGCKLKIDVIKAETYCEDCGCTYETVKYAKICPNCGSEHTYLIKGNETNIKEIEIEDD